MYKWAAAALAALGTVWSADGSAAADLCGLRLCETQTIAPATTTPDVPPGTEPLNAVSGAIKAPHYVVVPVGLPNRALVVFLPGSTASPMDYTRIAQQTAAAGYGFIGLSYPTNIVLGADYPLPGLSGCPQQPDPDGCYTQSRGEIVFGDGVHYAPDMPGYSSAMLTSQRSDVSGGDSVVHRLICLLDYLAHQPPGVGTLDPGYWSQFLVTGLRARNSPYLLPSSGYTVPAYPDWSRIVLAGHSQGGGNAAFLAMTLPQPLRRVVLFSAPQDAVAAPDGSGLQPAQWLLAPSRTPMQRFIGLCNGSTPGSDGGADGDATCSYEGDYGNQVTRNWEVMGGIGLGGPLQSMTSVGDGSLGLLLGARRLYLTAPFFPVSFKEHSATAADNTAAMSIYPLWQAIMGIPGELSPTD